MTRSETATLLAFAAAYDQRTVGQTDVAAWYLALQQYSLDQAQLAVIEHYRDRRERVMPADVIGYIRAAQRPDGAPFPVIEGPKASPEHVAKCRSQIDALVTSAAGKFAPDDSDYQDPVPHWRAGMDKQELALRQAEASRRQRSGGVA